MDKYSIKYRNKILYNLNTKLFMKCEYFIALETFDLTQILEQILEQIENCNVITAVVVTKSIAQFYFSFTFCIKKGQNIIQN